MCEKFTAFSLDESRSGVWTSPYWIGTADKPSGPVGQEYLGHYICG
jgi:hypothetical protein